MNGTIQSRVNSVDLSPMTSPDIVLCSSCAFEVTHPIDDPFRTKLSVHDKCAIDLVENSANKVRDRLFLTWMNRCLCTTSVQVESSTSNV